MSTRNVIFRTDSSTKIGSGHLMRCLTLADELKNRDISVSFVCREHTGNLIELIEQKGYPVERLHNPDKEYGTTFDEVAHASWLGVSWEQDAEDTLASLGDTEPDWLIVDHYAIDRRWEQILRRQVGKILVIDDLADRPHDCDLLLDQNLYPSMETRYDDLVPKTCQKLIGPKYALLRPEFAAARKSLRLRSGEIKRVLVFFGGVDPTNETAKALQALAGISDRQLEVDVVVGGGNLYKEQIQDLCAVHDAFHYHCQVDNMAELMAAADLAIGAGGSATWERCFLDLPSISVVIADNQLETTKAVAAAGATMFLGYCNNVSTEALATAVRHLMKNPVQVQDMGKMSLTIMGSGLSCERSTLADVIIGDSHAKA